MSSFDQFAVMANDGSGSIGVEICNEGHFHVTMTSAGVEIGFPMFEVTFTRFADLCVAMSMTGTLQ